MQTYAYKEVKVYDFRKINALPASYYLHRIPQSPVHYVAAAWLIAYILRLKAFVLLNLPPAHYFPHFIIFNSHKELFRLKITTIKNFIQNINWNLPYS